MAKGGRGQIVGVMGEPGVGKSRLFYEFKILEQSGLSVLQAFSVSHGKAYPYLPLIELLRDYFQIIPQDDERTRQEKIAGKVVVLDRSLEDMMEAVHRYEGTVNQVMGDGIMALFGAPLAHEDHAVRACYAALRMQDAVNRYSNEVQRSQGIPVMIRVGLNSGEVVVGSVGNDLRMDYTAVGQTTHLAARMEQMAKPGSIVVSDEVISPRENGQGHGRERVQAL